MKNKIRNTISSTEFDAESYGQKHIDINEVIKFFTDAKNKGATHIEWYAKSDYDGRSEYCEATTFYEVEESDSEYEFRMNKESAMQKEEEIKRLIKEKQEYERLKAKFGN